MASHKFADKTVVLTGAAGGLGSAISTALSEQGARLVLIGRNGKALSALNQQLGGHHFECIADISTPIGREAIVSCCKNEIGHIDVVINNAGINRFSLFSAMTAETIAQIMHTNLISQILLCHDFLPLLSTYENTQIINIGSTFGSIGYPGFSIYSASKFGLRGFSEALSREIAGSSVAVRYFAPRAIKTAFNTDKVNAMNTALGNAVDSPEHVAKALVAFMGSQRRRCFLGWPEKALVKINGALPGLVDGVINKQLKMIKRYL